ncbi:hypothetical protein K490DRAFT_53638 [Saccharata proteae CBS 121410]|uniref:Uncharacterized protein n=1 Tax=Saccharata proteae CBS 121410 TaxID=1314787 RepID=A0A9P4I2G8_9PEZI|nr:hypothetical protein K490DRAFT_53638 [Saccharata proteae CBS 121410]
MYATSTRAQRYNATVRLRYLSSEEDVRGQGRQLRERYVVDGWVVVFASFACCPVEVESRTTSDNHAACATGCGFSRFFVLREEKAKRCQRPLAREMPTEEGEVMHVMSLSAEVATQSLTLVPDGGGAAWLLRLADQGQRHATVTLLLSVVHAALR